MKTYTTEYIGVIRTPFTKLEGMPIQPTGAGDVQGEVIINPDLIEGLRDLDGFSHIYLIYHLHKTNKVQMTVTPFMDTVPHGIFATRSPVRPARLGLSIVELLQVTDNRLIIRGADMLDESPLIDIKPYIPAFDCPVGDDVRVGWMTADRSEVSRKRSDQRFHDSNE